MLNFFVMKKKISFTLLADVPFIQNSGEIHQATGQFMPTKFQGFIFSKNQGNWPIPVFECIAEGPVTTSVDFQFRNLLVKQ